MEKEEEVDQRSGIHVYINIHHYSANHKQAWRVTAVQLNELPPNYDNIDLTFKVKPRVKNYSKIFVIVLLYDYAGQIISSIL